MICPSGAAIGTEVVDCWVWLLSPFCQRTGTENNSCKSHKNPTTHHLPQNVIDL